MRRYLVPILIGFVVCSLCGAALAGKGAGSKEAVVADLVEVLRAYAERPLEAPVGLEVKIPAGTEEVRLVYERLSFDEVHEVPAVLSGGIARAVIPAEHTTQPGVNYHWVVSRQGMTVTTADSWVPFFEGAGPASDPEDWVAHDIEKAGGTLPNGYSVTSQQGRIPHDLSASQAPVTSKLLELRNTPAADVHAGLDFGMATGNNVYAMEDGVASDNSEPGGWGLYVMISHANGKYLTHYTDPSEEYVDDGDRVWKGDLIGKSGDSGSGQEHLDTGYDYFDAVEGRIAVYPFEYFLPSYGTYLSTDFDFIQTPTNGYSSTKGSYTNVKVEHKGSSGGSDQVHIRYRQKGTSTWIEASVPLYSGITYRHYWDPALDGKTMEYWIKVKRSLWDPLGDATGEVRREGPGHLLRDHGGRASQEVDSGT